LYCDDPEAGRIPPPIGMVYLQTKLKYPLCTA